MKNVIALNSERHISRLIQVNLERQGMQVRVAMTPTHLLELIAEDAPDAILTDETMRFLGGFDVFKELKRNPETRGIRIVIVKPEAMRSCVFRGWGVGNLEPPNLDDLFDDGDRDEHDDTPQ